MTTSPQAPPAAKRDLRSALSWHAEAGRTRNQLRVVSSIMDTLSSGCMTDLARAWGAAPPPTSDPHELVAWYAQVARDHWDFRAGRERSQSRIPQLNPARLQAVGAVVEELGLDQATRPDCCTFDWTLILGARLGATLSRTSYARELAQTGVHLGSVISLGSLRSLDNRERVLAASLGPEMDTEFDAAWQSLRLVFGLPCGPDIRRGDDETSGEPWAEASFVDSRVMAMGAPSGAPGIRRSDTVDALTWWLATQRPKPFQRVLLVTSMLYVPYQAAVAARILGAGAGLSVETVGYRFSESAPWAVDPGPGPTHQLQEVCSMILGFSELIESDRTADPRRHTTDCPCFICGGRAAREVLAKKFEREGQSGLAWLYPERLLAGPLNTVTWSRKVRGLLANRSPWKSSFYES